MQGKLGPADRIVVRGQIDSMNQAFANLTIGLLFAAVFVYALMVVNYQSFLDPLAVILALPGAGSGIILLLFVTGTTFSVPSLMGAIMAVGVASANSILLVTFAREQREAGMSAFEAALSAGTTRLRPVLMTAAAMIVGMLPMAIGGPGEEQNAVLARAVIGGVLVGTITTLLFVPYLYSVIGKFERRAAPELPQSLMQPRSAPMNDIPCTPPETAAARGRSSQSPADPRPGTRVAAAPRGWLGLAAVVGAGAAGRRRRLGPCGTTGGRRSPRWRPQRDAVPVVRTAVVQRWIRRAQIDLPGIDAGVRHRDAVCPRDRLYRQAQRRYRQPRACRRRAGGDRRPRSRSAACPGARAAGARCRRHCAQAQANMELARVNEPPHSRSWSPGLDQPAAGDDRLG